MMAERVGFEPTERARRINNLLKPQGFHSPLSPLAYPHLALDLALAKAQLSGPHPPAWGESAPF